MPGNWDSTLLQCRHDLFICLCGLHNLINRKFLHFIFSHKVDDKNRLSFYTTARMCDGNGTKKAYFLALFWGGFQAAFLCPSKMPVMISDIQYLVTS